ncbi:MAG: hypothetical protein ACUVV6_02565 [Thermoplasmatota archaeon]
MSVELFGSSIAPYAIVACVISFLMSGHRSVYPSQKLAVRGAPSITVKLGEDMEHLHPKYSPREQALIRKGMKLARDIEKKLRKMKPPRRGYVPKWYISMVHYRE